MQVAELAKVVPHLDAEMFTVQQRQPLFDSLVGELAALFERLNDTDALSALAAALHHCTALPQPPLADGASRTADVMTASCIEQLSEAADAVGRLSDRDLKVRSSRACLHG